MLRKQVRFVSPRRSLMDCSLDCHEPRTAASSRNPAHRPVPPDRSPRAAPPPAADLDLSAVGSPAGPCRNNSAQQIHKVYLDGSSQAAPNTLGLDLAPEIFTGMGTNDEGRERISDDRGFFIRPDRPIETFALLPRPLNTTLTHLDRNPLKTKFDFPKLLPKTPHMSNDCLMNHPNDHNSTRCTCYKCIPKYNKEYGPTIATGYAQHHNGCHARSPNIPNNIRPNDELELSFCSPCLQLTPINYHQHCSHSSPQLIPSENASTKLCCSSQASTHAVSVNSAERKSKAIEHYELRNRPLETCSTEVATQQNVAKEKREPTVSDLFKIIKLQNEQLKLLQDRVDKLISNTHNTTDNTRSQYRPVQNFVQERVAVETVDENHHKISIGVMTSFEMVRTSVIHKEKTTSRNTQVQCNRSQISVKEMISAEPSNLNFLDGLMPFDRARGTGDNTCTTESPQRLDANENIDETSCTTPMRRRSADEEKTLNELSLGNFQIDNATTPQLSPDQTLYLDVKDYSDSDNDDQSDVGWTYYNKVMNHVNNMLQESHMPSSAGALHRQALGRCARLHLDRTDVSVTTSKRVTFDKNPVQIEPPQALPGPPPSSDASLQMNKLAAKYLGLKDVADAVKWPLDRKAPEIPLDMSLATRKYMEQHNLIRGGVKSPPPAMPTKFLDITALKQQPKLL